MSQKELDALLRNDFPSFLAKVFETVSPGDEYRDNWHILTICHELERIRTGESKRLIINQPPRTLKSIAASIAYPAFVLGHDPTQSFICVSYSTDLAQELHQKFRRVVESDWYQRIFPKMRARKDTGAELTTTAGGRRLATSVGGTLTGRGADCIIIDDPLKAEEAQSDLARQKVIDWYKETLVSRLNDPQRGSIMLVMQRLHEWDLTGYLLDQGGWTHLNLPAIFNDEKWFDLYGTEEVNIVLGNELLHPERLSRDVLDQTKREIGSMVFQAQYLQAPVPAEGNMIKREWFKSYKIAPDRAPGDLLVQSWDFAMTTGETRDYSVCTTWLLRKQVFFLLDVWRDRIETPDLLRKMAELSRTNGADTVLIEDAGPGLFLLQSLRREPPQGMPVPIGIKPEGSKKDRMMAQTPKIEAGQILLPEEAHWKPAFLDEMLSFPGGRHDDQVDSVSQFLAWTSKRWHDDDYSVGLDLSLFAVSITRETKLPPWPPPE